MPGPPPGGRAGRSHATACTYTAGAGRNGGMPYAESCYPVHPAAYRVRTQYSGQKERIKHPGGAGEDPLVKALEPPTPQHPPAPLTRLPNTIPPSKYRAKSDRHRRDRPVHTGRERPH